MPFKERKLKNECSNLSLTIKRKEKDCITSLSSSNPNKANLENGKKKSRWVPFQIWDKGKVCPELLDILTSIGLAEYDASFFTTRYFFYGEIF